MHVPNSKAEHVKTPAKARLFRLNTFKFQDDP